MHGSEAPDMFFTLAFTLRIYHLDSNNTPVAAVSY